MQRTDTVWRGEKKTGCSFYVVTPLFLCSERNVGKGRREGSLAIEQRNNNTRTRTFRQKKKTNHVFHSGDGELNGGRDRNFTSLSLPLSRSRRSQALRLGVDPVGPLHLNSHTVLTRAFVCDCTVSAPLFACVTSYRASRP